jgi:hypothetical protein
MLAGCVGKLGWGEVNFLLTTPNPERGGEFVLLYL